MRRFARSRRQRTSGGANRNCPTRVWDVFRQCGGRVLRRVRSAPRFASTWNWRRNAADRGATIEGGTVARKRDSASGCGQPAAKGGSCRQSAAPPGPSFVDRFRGWANATSCAFGSPWALGAALALVLAWAMCGPYFGFSAGWQMVINTGTTIVTFLMAFLIQATQFRESEALHLKIDELLRAVSGARTSFVNVNELPEEDLRALAAELHAIGEMEAAAPVADSSAPVRAVADELERVANRSSRARAKRPSANGASAKALRGK
ncbi:MAG: low affinity iron permease family protein [Proteobacteria bacterium]|nr:low affinity iron permease family protein [Pseudomonadota bacterium]